jgi:hypothetical protein
MSLRVATGWVDPRPNEKRRGMLMRASSAHQGQAIQYIRA